MLVTMTSSWAGRGGGKLSWLIPLLAAPAVFTTRNGPRDSPHNWTGPPGGHGAAAGRGGPGWQVLARWPG
jgi:hypothetical protein